MNYEDPKGLSRESSSCQAGESCLRECESVKETLRVSDDDVCAAGVAVGVTIREQRGTINVSLRRLNLSKNQWLTLGISFMALIVAIVSAVFAALADKYAKEANQIAISANDLASQSLTQALPEIEFSNWDQAYYDLNLDEYPCINEFGNTVWRRNLIVYIDLTNIGGQTIALLGAPESKESNPIYNGVHVKATFTPFYFVERFDEWLKNGGWNPLEAQIREHAKLVIPLNLAAGETRRVVLGEHVEVRIDSNVDPQELIGIVLDHDSIAHLQFPFAQQKTLQATIPISMPYIGTRLDAKSVPPFEACQN